MLKKHLKDLGLKSFSNKKELHRWGINYVKKNNVSTDLFREFLYYLDLINYNNNYQIKKKLYQISSSNKVLLNYFHSIKFKNIFISGKNIIDHIKNTKIVLDLGCNSGYLTSYYAKTYNNTYFYGIDNCLNATYLAKKTFKSYKNLQFINSFNVIKSIVFDYIIDTQCLSDIDSKKSMNNLLKNCYSCLDINGYMLSIATLQNEKEAKAFIKIVCDVGFFLNKVEPMIFRSFSHKECYTKLLFSKKNTYFNFQIEDYFRMVRHYL